MLFFGLKPLASFYCLQKGKVVDYSRDVQKKKIKHANVYFLYIKLCKHML